jgi:hypothetical protein
MPSLTPNPNLAQRAKTIAFWMAPPLLSLLLYWPGLLSWFQKDDFAWLGLRDLVHSWHDFWWALFAPLAQGTIRTLSERVFYLSFFSAFGMHALPYRCWAFLTHAATLIVLSAVCTKLTGSRAAGFWAAVLWTINSALAFALSWTAIYYEILCSFMFLVSFWLLLRYVETGERRFYLAQCATFVLGFGVLELNVVYPALALVYALCCAPRIIRKILPLFIISAAYSVVHFAVAPMQSNGPYRMFWDTSVFSTLSTYWKYSLGPSKLILLGIHPSFYRSALTVFLTVGLLGFLVWKLRGREWIAAFFPAWFLIVLAPLLPLRNHISDYYLTVPLIGLAMWGAWAFVTAWRAGMPARIAALSLLIIYVCVSVPLARVNVVSFYERSQRIRAMVLGVVNLSRAQPDKMILLTGVDSDMFWSAIYHRPFRLFGIYDVHLAPENEASITPAPSAEDRKMFFLDPAAAKDAVVIDVSAGQVRNVTPSY